MPDIQSLPLPWLSALFIASALLIAYFGSKMAAIADVLADRTGLGEALIGAVLLGAGTSISGIVTSITTAAKPTSSSAQKAAKELSRTLFSA